MMMRMMKRKLYIFHFYFPKTHPDSAQYTYLCHLTLTLQLSIQIDNSSIASPPPAHYPHPHFYLLFQNLYAV